MPEFIANRIQFVFSAISLALFVWILIDTRRSLGLLTVSDSKTLSDRKVFLFRCLAGLIVAGLTVAILNYVL